MNDCLWLYLQIMLSLIVFTDTVFSISGLLSSHCSLVNVKDQTGNSSTTFPLPCGICFHCGHTMMDLSPGLHTQVGSVPWCHLGLFHKIGKIGKDALLFTVNFLKRAEQAPTAEGLRKQKRKARAVFLCKGMRAGLRILTLVCTVAWWFECYYLTYSFLDPT